MGVIDMIWEYLARVYGHLGCCKMLAMMGLRNSHSMGKLKREWESHGSHGLASYHFNGYNGDMWRYTWQIGVGRLVSIKHW